jgi:hypothetical protein
MMMIRSILLLLSIDRSLAAAVDVDRYISCCCCRSASPLLSTDLTLAAAVDGPLRCYRLIKLLPLLLFVVYVVAIYLLSVSLSMRSINSLVAVDTPSIDVSPTVVVLINLMSND